MLKDFQVRVVANACITQINEGKGTIDQVVSIYSMQADDLDKVLAYVYVIRPDLVPVK